VLVGCGSDFEAPDATVSEPLVPEPRLSSIQENVFTPGCAAFASCHDSNSPAADLNLTDGHSYAQLVNVKSSINPEETRVIPGFSEDSFLIKKLRDHLGPLEQDGEAMPLRNPPLDEETIQAIEEWIDAGAAND